MKPGARRKPGSHKLAGSVIRSIRRGTVREALEAYLADLRRHGRLDTARQVEVRFKTVVDEDAIAELELEAVTRDDDEQSRGGEVSNSAGTTSSPPGSPAVHPRFRRPTAPSPEDSPTFKVKCRGAVRVPTRCG